MEVNLQPEEFHDALQKGMGRAYLHVNKYGDSQVSDSILYCCLHNLSYKKYNSPHTYIAFAKYAVEAEFNLVFEKFLHETRKEQIVRYLWIFRKREIPIIDDKLFQLAMSDDGDIRTAAVEALKFCQDSSIRNLAIDFSKNQDDKFAICSVGLFIKNYQSGDNKFIESILPRINDEDTKHFVCMDLIKIFERHALDELFTSLLWAYENTPCTYCRENIVKALINSNLMPQILVDECQFDCVQDVRNLVRGYTRA